MYNFADFYPTLFDNSGRPLTGKLVFLDAHTGAPRAVYSSDGTVLDSVQYVNVHTEQQIFLEGDYLVRLYKYIGDGACNTGDTDSDFLLQRSFQVLDSDTGAILKPEVYGGVSALKDYPTEGLADGYTIQVGGYYTATDCPVRTFVWNSQSTVDADNGLVFRSNNSGGRWILSNDKDYIDVRWYGDIPTSSSTGTSYDSQRKLAQIAANKYGKTLYFPITNLSEPYYVFTGTDYTVNGTVLIDNAARFSVNLSQDSSIFTFKANRIEHTGELIVQVRGLYRLDCPVVHTSWFAKGWTYSTNTFVEGIQYVVDSTRANHFVNCSITVTDNTELEGAFLDNVAVTGTKFLDSKATIRNCKHLSDNWFTDNTAFASSIVLNGNTMDITDFKDARIYILFKGFQYDYDYGDLQGRTIVGALLGNSNTAYTASFSNGTLARSYLEGRTVCSHCTLDVSGSNTNATLDATDSVITCPVDIDSITATDSDVDLGNSIHSYSTVDLTDCNFKHTNTIYITGKLRLVHCICDGNPIRLTDNFDWTVTDSSAVNLTEYSTDGQPRVRNCICRSNTDFVFNDEESNVSAFSDTSEWDIPDSTFTVNLSKGSSFEIYNFTDFAIFEWTISTTRPELPWTCPANISSKATMDIGVDARIASIYTTYPKPTTLANLVRHVDFSGNTIADTGIEKINLTFNTSTDSITSAQAVITVSTDIHG